MARNDGIDRTSVQNVNLTAVTIGNTQRHNEREKDSYTNPDIMSERTGLNIHFKRPSAGYAEIFEQIVADGTISTRGLKKDAHLYGELIFDVNLAYFDRHGGYNFAKQFYADAYQAAIKIVGGEQYILSAIMHADERNRAMSEALGQDVYHYHLHVVYIPVVEKKVLWSKRCKDKSLVGTVEEVITQVSSSKKWQSKPATDEHGKPILQKSGEDHLTVTQFKVAREQERLLQLQAVTVQAQAQADRKNRQAKSAERQAAQAQAKLNAVAPVLKNMEKLAEEFSEVPEQVLPEAGPLELARSYREKKAKPLWAKIVKVLWSVYQVYCDLKYKFERLKRDYDREVSKNNSLSGRIYDLCDERDSLKGTVRDYERVRRAIGPEQTKRILEAACRQEQTEKERKRTFQGYNSI